jgi:tetratricopeptide (TPR) repeat protein
LSVVKISLVICFAVVLGTACSKNKRDGIAIANQAVRQFEQQDFDTAYNLFIRSLEVYPENATAYYHLGLIDFYKRSNLNGAEKHFRQTAALNPRDKAAYYQLGRVLFTRAQRKWVRLKAAVLSAKVQLQEARGGLHSATQTLADLEKNDPQGDEAAEAAANRILLEKKVSDNKQIVKTAGRTLDAAKQVFIDSRPPYEQALRAAVQELDETLKLDPNYSLAWYIKGRALKGLGKLDEADQAWRESIAIRPSDSRPYLALSDLYFEYDALDTARTVLSEGLKHNADDPDLLAALGTMQMRTNLDKLAIESFRKAIIRDPDRLDCIYNIAFAYARYGNPRKAIQYLDTYLANEKSDGKEQVIIAKALRRALVPDLN